MHLPARIRRRITYAAVATLLFGGLPLAAKVGPNAKPASQRPAVTSASEQAPTDLARTEFDPPVPMSVAQAETAAANGAEAAAAEAQPRPKYFTYTVEEGDTVSGIAEKFGLKMTSILWANDLRDGDFVQVGQELKIPAVDGAIHEVEVGDNLWQIASDYGVDFTEIVAANPDVDPEALQPGQVLLIPGGEPPRRRLSNMVASRGVERQAAPSGKFDRWPVSGGITDRFGWRIHPVYGTSHFHDGLDLNAPLGTPVGAVAAGEVIFVGRNGGYGLVVKVDHGGGVVTMYAHLGEAVVSVGQQVAAGELIAYSGNTGTTTGPHLHFTVLVGGSPVDPIDWLP